MHTAYYKEYSHSLGRDMEFMVYGHSGKPCVVCPAQDVYKRQIATSVCLRSNFDL